LEEAMLPSGTDACCGAAQTMKLSKKQPYSIHPPTHCAILTNFRGKVTEPTAFLFLLGIAAPPFVSNTVVKSEE
jgi:hypothetical protein